MGRTTELRAATWSEMFPVARTVPVDDMTGNTLTVDQSGTAAGYVLYTHRAGAATATIDAADQMDHCIEVKASYVIIRGLTLRSPKIHGIVLAKDAHDVVIEGCDISGWGRIDKDGWGIDYDSAIYSKYQPLTRVVIQRNRLHDPRSNSNSWQEFREGGERYHPKGPQAICFFESAGNHVFRYNEFTTDEKHYCNDIFGGGANRSLRGFPAPTPTFTVTTSRAAGTTGWSWKGAAVMSASGVTTLTVRWSRSPSPGCRSGRSTSSATSPASAVSVTQAGAASRF